MYSGDDDNNSFPKPVFFLKHLMTATNHSQRCLFGLWGFYDTSNPTGPIKTPPTGLCNHEILCMYQPPDSSFKLFSTKGNKKEGVGKKEPAAGMRAGAGCRRNLITSRDSGWQFSARHWAWPCGRSQKDRHKFSDNPPRFVTLAAHSTVLTL